MIGESFDDCPGSVPPRLMTHRFIENHDDGEEYHIHVSDTSNMVIAKPTDIEMRRRSENPILGRQVRILRFFTFKNVRFP